MTDGAVGTARREPLVGEEWAYRARSMDPLVQVVVLRIGVKTPKRVLIRFVDDEFEGQQDWVPPARLKVLWREVVAFMDREARWAGVLAASPAGAGRTWGGLSRPRSAPRSTRSMGAQSGRSSAIGAARRRSA